MTASFHEDLSRADEIKGPGDRAFGLTVGGILLLIVAVRGALGTPGLLEAVLGPAGAALVGFGLVAPAVLAPLNKAWLRLGLLLSKVVSPIALGLIYVTTIVPVGLIRQALGHDSLRRKFDPAASSYWIMRDPPGPPPETMKNQF